MPYRSFTGEFSERLRGLSDQELWDFYRNAQWFTNVYASGYELDGHILLVLDNSLIQDFKHRHAKPERGLNALAYTAFCRLVAGWSDRPTALAVSPAAVYEHLGKRSVERVEDAIDAFSDIRRLLEDTRLKLTSIGFQTPKELHNALIRIAEDDRYLTKYVAEIDNKDWKVDLKDRLGVKIPMSIAFDQIPDDLPLRYFNPWYVKFTLSARIEQHIVAQATHNPDALPVGSGELSIALADLNKIRRGMLQGLGDIDLLQFCDVNRQYQEQSRFVLLGQTLDRGLMKVLAKRHRYFVEASVVCGSSNSDQQIDKMVKLMVSNPFAREEERGRRIRAKLAPALDALGTACREARGKMKH